MARNWIGSNVDAGECGVRLNKWIKQYCVNPNGASDETKAKYPLSDASVQVQAVAGKPGWYEAVAYLKPHFQMETLTASMRLVAEVPKKG
jgi:type VI secretion system protein ImpC